MSPIFSWHKKVETELYNATILPVSVAQRVSVLVTARNDAEADQHDWALIANMNPAMFNSVSEPSLFIRTGALITTLHARFLLTCN